MMKPITISKRDFITGSLASLALWKLGCSNQGRAVDAGIPDAGLPTKLVREPGGFASPPSRFTASLGLDAAGRVRGVATGGGDRTGDRNHLFGVNPLDPRRPIPSETQLELSIQGEHRVNHLTAISEETGVLTANDGFHVVPLSGSGDVPFVPFPAGSDRGGGAVFSQGKLFIAVSNFDETSWSYREGQILVYQRNPDGTFQLRSILRTSGLNPTGLALLDPDTLVGLNSGDFQNPQSSLDLRHIPTEEIRKTIPLGAFTAQVTSKIALTPDRKTAIVGTADGSGRLPFVDLDTSQTSIKSLPPDSFHTSIQIGGGLVYVTAFGGTVTMLSLADQSILHSLKLASGEAGPSLILEDGTLLQTMPYEAIRIIPE